MTGERAIRPRAWTLWPQISVAIWVLSPTFLFSASTQAESDPTIWEGRDQSVRLSSQDDEAALPNDHPVTLAANDIERMLSRLRLKYADQESEAVTVPVFGREQIEILGEAVAAGLARAKPSQDVIFSVIGTHQLSPGAFASRNRLTAGRIFHRDGHLNVIFGEIQSPYRKKNIYGQVDQDFYPREYGSRASAEEHDAILVTSASSSLHRGQDGIRDDWVVINPDLASADPVPPSDPVEESRLMESESESPRGKSPPAAAPKGPTPAIVDTSGQAEESARQPKSGDTNDIEQRLETLKRLRKNDLISEEAYRKKVDDILKDL